MSDTFSIRVDGCEIARITGSVSFGKRLALRYPHQQVLVDDPKMLRVTHNERVIASFYVSSSDNITVEKVEG